MGISVSNMTGEQAASMLGALVKARSQAQYKKLQPMRPAAPQQQQFGVMPPGTVAANFSSSGFKKSMGGTKKLAPAPVPQFAPAQPVAAPKDYGFGSSPTGEYNPALQAYMDSLLGIEPRTESVPPPVVDNSYTPRQWAAPSGGGLLYGPNKNKSLAELRDEGWNF